MKRQPMGKKVTQVKSGHTTWIDIFQKKDIKMAKEYLKRCLPSLIMRERQMWTTVSNHLTLARMVPFKNTRANKCWAECGEMGTLGCYWWECKLL